VNLTDIRKGPKHPRKYKFAKGKGHSSGIGKTCGRGRKGQYARQGTSFRPYFEGGQMPMLRRLPKFGFNNSVFKTDWEVVNVGVLEKAFAAGETVDEASLRAKGLVRREADGIKVLGEGALTKKLIVKVDAATKQAEAKIAKAGGTLERLIAPKPEKKARAKAEAPKADSEKKGEAPKKGPEGKAPPAK
jgi:large subunit ribosomal protein L15